MGHSVNWFPERFKLVKWDSVPKLAGRGEAIALLCISRKVRPSKPAISSGMEESSFEEAFMTVRSAYSHHLGAVSLSTAAEGDVDACVCGEKEEESETCCICWTTFA